MVYAYLPNDVSLAPVFSKKHGVQYPRYTVKPDYLVVSHAMKDDISDFMALESNKHAPTLVIEQNPVLEWRTMNPC
jgi:beta-lactamase superfamily II metal-dependent hydrolase